MAKFDAAADVESMDYDFTKFGGSKGTIPEPSDKQVRAYFREATQIARDAGAELPDNATQAQVTEAMDRILSEELGEELQARSIASVAAVCSDVPSGEEVQRLPHRVRQAFIGWLTKELQDPSTAIAATRP